MIHVASAFLCSASLVVGTASAMQAPTEPAAKPQAAPAGPANTDKAHATKPGWYAGDFESLLAESARSKKLVMLDFWTSWCGWCKRLDADTLSSAPVVTALKDVLCSSVDAESETGRPIAERYKPTGFPCLVFLDPDGLERDRIAGFLPPAEFLIELQRIQDGDSTLGDARERANAEPANVFALGNYIDRLKRVRDEQRIAVATARVRELVQRGAGFDVANPYQQWRVAEVLRQVNDASGADARIDAIRKLGEPGTRFLERRRMLDEAIGQVTQSWQREQKIDCAPFVGFLATETHPELRWDAQVLIRNMERYRASEHRKAGRADDERAARAAARAASRTAWKDCPPVFAAEFGREVVYDIPRSDAAASVEEQTFAVEVARAAAQLAPQSAAHQDLLGRALAARGYGDEALTAYQRALELDPSRSLTRARIDALRKPAATDR